MPEVIATTIVRARKRHLCSWHPFRASNPHEEHSIEPGQLYERSVNGDGGRVWTWKACAYHRAAASAAFCIYQLDELDAYGLADIMHEWWNDAEASAERGIPFECPFVHDATQPGFGGRQPITAERRAAS